MKNNKPLVVIAGLGEGLGRGLAEFFMDKGYQVLGLNRRELEDKSSWLMMSLDLSDEAAVNAAAKKIIQGYGSPHILIHNTQSLVIAPFEKTTAKDFQNVWQSIAYSAFLLGQAFLPTMAKQKDSAVSPTMIVSGATASIRGGEKFSALSSAKFALRGLTQSMARTYQPLGVHIAHVLLDGIVDSEKSRELHHLPKEKMMQVADIANTYWQLSQQPKSTWTHELDLRPVSESF